MKRPILALIFCVELLSGQTTQPTAPDRDSGGGGGTRSLDLSKVPKTIPTPAKTQALTSEELQLKPVQLFVLAVGEIPPPIIYLDEQGMPREKYRDPLEYAPKAYHVRTEKATLRLIGAQNQVGPPTSIPRKTSLELLYEVPPDNPEDGVIASARKNAELRTIATLPFPPEATHLVAVVWKESSSQLWDRPKAKLVDISPSNSSPSEVLFANLSAVDLGVFRGETSRRLASNFVGKLKLPQNEAGQVPLVLAASINSRWQRLSQTMLNLRESEQLFVVSWPEKPSNGRPLGVAVSFLTKRLTEPDPF